MSRVLPAALWDINIELDQISYTVDESISTTGPGFSIGFRVFGIAPAPIELMFTASGGTALGASAYHAASCRIRRRVYTLHFYIFYRGT